jgi:1,2-diacylglycerol-3-alpha-glucose alpha-1,2-galactosyltransferase
MLLILQQKLYHAQERADMKVNVISESAFTAQGHGVHTAFTETLDALHEYSSIDAQANTSRPADVTHIHTTGPYALKKLLWDRGAKVVSAHVTPDSFVGSLIGAKYWYRAARWYLTWFYNRADVVLAVSEEVTEELSRMGVKKPVVLVPNTIRTELYRNTLEKRQVARRNLGIPEDAFVVMGSGQVQPRKRIDVVIKCAKALPEVTFIWVGGMPFKQLAADHAGMAKVMDEHPRNVRITGVVDRAEVIQYYQASDLFFLPSAQETFGIVIVEAAAAGLPVLLRDLAQYRKTFANGYEKGSGRNFAELIDRFRRDKEYYRHWQKAASVIAQRYDAKVGIEALTKAYEQAIQLATKKAEP